MRCHCLTNVKIARTVLRTKNREATVTNEKQHFRTIKWNNIYRKTLFIFFEYHKYKKSYSSLKNALFIIFLSFPNMKNFFCICVIRQIKTTL